MNDDIQRRLVKKLITKRSKAAAGVRIRRATVVSVSGSTATITLGSDEVAGVPFYAHAAGLSTGSKVDVMFDGNTPIILGELA